MTKFVDTNILAYSMDERDSRKQQIAKVITIGLINGTHITSVQVLGEFCRVSTEKIGAPTQEIIDFLEPLTPLLYTKNTIEKAIQIRNHKVPFWDALIAATMLEHNISEIYTEDEVFNRIPGIKAINPFK